MSSALPFRFRSGNEDLPHFRDVAELAVWHDGNRWRIGPRGDTTSPPLHRVLALAADGQFAAIAWSLLLRAEFDAAGVAELQAEVRRPEWQGKRLELTPLFARLATTYPLEVASMFPEAIAVEVLQLCGEHGIVAALRAIVDDDEDAREPGSIAIADMAELGVELAPDQVRAVRAAAAHEPDVEIRENLDDALRAIDARGGAS